MAFSKGHKILVKNLQQLKGYTAIPIFLENSEPKMDKSTNSDNSETNCYTYTILLNHILVYCMLMKSFESLLKTYNCSVM